MTQSKVAAHVVEIRCERKDAGLLQSLLLQAKYPSQVTWKFVPQGIDQSINPEALRKVLREQNQFNHDIAVIAVSGLTENAFSIIIPGQETKTIDQCLMEKTSKGKRLIIAIERTTETKTHGKHMVLVSRENREEALAIIDEVICGRGPESVMHNLAQEHHGKFLMTVGVTPTRAGKVDFGREYNAYVQQFQTPNAIDADKENQVGRFNEPQERGKRQRSYASATATTERSVTSTLTQDKTSTVQPSKSPMEHPDIKNRFAAYDTKMGEMQTELVNLKTGQTKNTRMFESMEHRLETEFDRLGGRFDKLFAMLGSTVTTPSKSPSQQIPVATPSPMQIDTMHHTGYPEGINTGRQE